MVPRHTQSRQPYGLTHCEPIGPYLNHHMPTKWRNSHGWEAIPAFPGLHFQDPTTLVAEPRSNRLYVGERQGAVYFFDRTQPAPEKRLFLDLRKHCQGWDDSGLLAIAFHPEFGQTGSPNRGFFYVWYNYIKRPFLGPNRPPRNLPTSNRLSRFEIRKGSLVADPNSEMVLIDQYDECLWHNGGGMFFHPRDGFLYLSLGDEGIRAIDSHTNKADDYGNTQRIDRDLFSGVIRIDVDCKGGAVSHRPPRGPATGKTGHYYIPNDNPWVGMPGVLEEFWCIGLRNPHRMTYDEVSGDIWAGDTGEDNYEEMNIIERAGNYQWRYREGTSPGPNRKSKKPLGVEKPPFYQYFRAEGIAVIGGYVYRGREYRDDLGGKYIFGDYGGKVWALTFAGRQVPCVEHLCDLPSQPSLSYGMGLSSFGVDQEGEIYLCQLGSRGGVYRLKRSENGVTPVPRLLSQTGAFRNVGQLTPSQGLIPYDVNSPLWSDSAIKSRWMALPTNSDGKPFHQIILSKDGRLVFPPGSVFVKHFELSVDADNREKRKRLETRLLVCDEEGTVYGATYKWRDDQSDAELLEDALSEEISVKTSRSIRSQTWYYPGPQECLYCHNPNSNKVLGLKLSQINRNFSYTSSRIDNQIRAWNHIGLFSVDQSEDGILALPKLVAIDDEREAPERRVRSYLDANCAHCHHPFGVRAGFDARFETPIERQGLIEATAINSLGVPGGKLISLSGPENSLLYLRLMSKDPNIMMPPIAHGLVDEQASAAFRAWIGEIKSRRKRFLPLVTELR